MAEPTREPERPSISGVLLAIGLALGGWSLYNQFFGDHPPPAATAEETAAAESAEQLSVLRAARAHLGATATLRNDAIEATVDNLGGGLTSLKLLNPRFRQDDEPRELVTTDREEYRPLRITLAGLDLPGDAAWQLDDASDHAVRLRYEGRGYEVVRRIELGRGPYELWQTVRVRNTGRDARRFRFEQHGYQYVRRADEASGMFRARPLLVGQGVCRHDGSVTRKTRDALGTPHGYGGAVDFVGVENTYFIQAITTPDTAERCGMRASDRGIDGEGDPEGALFEVALRFPVTELQPGEEHVFRTMTFFGPKDWDELGRAGHSLRDVVDLGTFASIARVFAYLLRLIHDNVVPNWGLAIIILTVLLRIALFPVMNYQFKTMMAPMRKLQPEISKLNELYGSDLEKRNAAMMELYRKHGINPASQLVGCLPLLLQMPVFFAFYASLSTNIELYHQPFALWWTDLSAPDRFFALPLLLAVLMHVQQRITPTNVDAQQQRMLLWMMPIMMGVFMLFLPSGLCLYSLTNSVLGIAQQRFNEWRLQRETPATPIETTPQPAKVTDKPAGAGRTRRGG